ncbi:MAG: ATP-binding protein [Thermodesulfobacteriota bacterium]
MKRLGVLILIFCAALAVPLAYLVFRTYQGLKQEEEAELRYFAEAVFDQMQAELAEFVRREESRAIDQYLPPPFDQNRLDPGQAVPPRFGPPPSAFILAYFQNNPDGSFHSPMFPPGLGPPPDQNDLAARLDQANKTFNTKKTDPPEAPVRPPTEARPPRRQEVEAGFASRYVDVDRLKKPKDHLGQQQKRVEQLTDSQAANLAFKEAARKSAGQESAAEGKRRSEGAPPFFSESSRPSSQPGPPPPNLDGRSFQAEVDPLQSVFVGPDLFFVFRRVVVDRQVYRQGALISANGLARHLAAAHFEDQPLARFTGLDLLVVEQGRERPALRTGAASPRPILTLNRVFPRPFSFLRARLVCDQAPPSPGRSTLMAMLIVLAAVILAGLAAIYQSVRRVVELSERRTGFVSSVTHELKTPLTNIRLYIEMLEMGLAADQDQEQDYFRIIGSETVRLSRLINNVLEFSKLENKKRRLDLVEGDLSEVVTEVKDVMAGKIRQEGFTLTVAHQDVPVFAYDREAMIQILINLIENSLKFGREAVRREIVLRVESEGRQVKISVADTGPGIPGHALKRVFDDFYRVDNSLTRNTGGTGLGLALVKKLAEAMGGTAAAVNNPGAGCTVTVTLPAERNLLPRS